MTGPAISLKSGDCAQGAGIHHLSISQIIHSICTCRLHPGCTVFSGSWGQNVRRERTGTCRVPLKPHQHADLGAAMYVRSSKIDCNQTAAALYQERSSETPSPAPLPRNRPRYQHTYAHARRAKVALGELKPSSGFLAPTPAAMSSPDRENKASEPDPDPDPDRKQSRCSCFPQTSNFLPLKCYCALSPSGPLLPVE